MKRTFLSLSKNDFIKGLVMAALVPVFVIIQQSIAGGNLIFDWKAITMAAIAGLVGYLTKNFFTDDVKAAQKTLEAARKSAIKDNAPAGKP